MCDPLTIGSAALTIGSHFMNAQAASKAAKARDGAMAAERIRQQGLQHEATAINNNSRERFTGFQDQEKDKAAALADFFKNQNTANDNNAANEAGVPSEVMPSSSSNVVNQEVAKQGAKTAAYSDQQDTALGGLRGFGDLLGDISRLQGRDAAQVGTIGGFMKGSSSVLPYELEAANNKGAGLKQLADIFGGVGQIGMSAGLSGAGAGLFGAGTPAVDMATYAAAPITPVQVKDLAPLKYGSIY